MKKLIFALTAIFAVTFASCTKEELDILNETTKTTQSNLSVYVSTQDVYDKFGITENAKTEILNTSDYKIGVFSYLYDSEDNLAYSNSSTTSTFGQISQDFGMVKAGSYTLVTVETMVDATTGLPSKWDFVGTNKLQTIEVAYKNGYKAMAVAALGVYTGKVTVADQGVVVDATPSPIGSIVQTYYINFEKSSYDEVGFYTKNSAKGRYLSPNITGSNRFDDADYTEAGYWYYRDLRDIHTGMYYFDDNTVGSYLVYLLDEGQITYTYGVNMYDKSFNPYPADGATITVKDGNTYYGMISYVGGEKGSDCAATICNTFNELNTWYGNLQFNFGGSNTTTEVEDAEPYLVWGSSASTVKTYMTGKGMNYVQDGSDSSGDYVYNAYSNPAGTLSYYYWFDTNNTNLDETDLYYDSSAYSYSTIKSAIASKYTYAQRYDDYGVEVYYSDDTIVYLYDEEDGGIIVAYVAYDNGNDDNQSSTTTSSDVAPYLVWGSSASTVKTYMANNGTTFVQDGEWDVYTYSYFTNQSQTLYYCYWFDENQTNMDEVDLTYDATVYAYDNIYAALNKGYTYAGRNDDYECEIFYSDDTLVVLYDEEDEVIEVSYVEYSTTSTSPAKVKAAAKAVAKAKAKVRAKVKKDVRPHFKAKAHKANKHGYNAPKIKQSTVKVCGLRQRISKATISPLTSPVELNTRFGAIAVRR